MKAKNVLDKLKDLKLRRWGPAEYTEAKNSNGGGTGLTGNLLDDWVNAVTQGEYTKYEDIPEADTSGLLTGWRRKSGSYVFDFRYFPEIQSVISIGGDTIPLEIAKNAIFKNDAE